MVSTAEHRREVALGRVRRALVRRAATLGVPANDVEDVVQDALMKALGERPRPNAPPFPARASAALDDKRREFFRAEARRRARTTTLMIFDEGTSDEGERPEFALLDSGYALLELADAVTAIAGEDAMRFAVLRSFGATEDDVALLLRWPPNRAAAARVQLGRKKAELIALVLDQLPD